MFNLTSNEPLLYIRYKKILQSWSNLRSAQSITGLKATRYQLTSRVGQVLLIDRKQPKKMLTGDQDN